MSIYEDYDSVSSVYDRSRSAVAFEQITSLLQPDAHGSASLRILDAGCGTGNYTSALRCGGHEVTAIDLNTGMLRAAREKQVWTGAVLFVRGDIRALPFKSSEFDAVLLSQVLHHLGPPSGEAGRAALRELHRTLKPGAKLVVVMTSPAQLRDGFWWTTLIPDACGRMAARLCSPSELADAMCPMGFADVQHVVPPDVLIQGEANQNPRALLDETLRAGDSTWALATAQETKRGLDQLRMILAGNEWSQFFRQKEVLRRQVGQITLLSARKAN